MKLSRETRQKEILSKELAKISSFFTAEEIHAKVRKKDSKIGIATVYRFLKDLRKKSQVHTYTCNRRVLYSKEKNSHCHFTCQKCHKITHFNLDKIDFLKNKLGDVCHFQLDIEGTCQDCKRNPQ